jgi:hypothetical protein
MAHYLMTDRESSLGVGEQCGLPAHTQPTAREGALRGPARNRFNRGSLRDLLEGLGGGAFDHLPGVGKPRAVARAVPRRLSRVPFQCAAQVILTAWILSEVSR